MVGKAEVPEIAAAISGLAERPAGLALSPSKGRGPTARLCRDETKPADATLDRLPKGHESPTNSQLSSVQPFYMSGEAFAFEMEIDSLKERQVLSGHHREAPIASAARVGKGIMGIARFAQIWTLRAAEMLPNSGH